MVLQRWEPTREIRRMQEMMDRLWRSLGWPDGGEVPESWAIPMDVIEEPDKIVVNATMPGVKPEDIQVTIEDSTLTIKGQTKMEREQREENYLMRERRTGSFYRSLRLPESVDTERADTRYEHGVLTLSFPKVESKRARRLEIKTPTGA